MSKELDSIMTYLQDGNEIAGTFVVRNNENDNLELSVSVPVTYVDEETGEESEESMDITQEIPASMIKMAKLMGVF